MRSETEKIERLLDFGSLASKTGNRKLKRYVSIVSRQKENVEALNRYYARRWSTGRLPWWMSKWYKARMIALRRDNFICVFCGSNEDLEVDHIQPRKKGGSDDLSNLRTLCHKCHMRYVHGVLKEDMPMATWIALRNQEGTTPVVG